MHPDFDPQPTLRSDTLLLRPLLPNDLEPLFGVANDPALWAGHPATDRHKRDVFEPYFNMLCATGGTLAISDAKTGAMMGCSRYYAAPDHADSVSIGFTFLGRAWWGGSVNFAMKTLMLNHAFACVDAVWLHIAPTNIRSQRATAKLGAAHAYDSTLGPDGADGLWQCWRLDRDVWEHVYRSRPT